MTAKSKAELMRESRERRKKAGLVHFREWVSPKEKQALEELLAEMREIREKNS